MKSLTLVAVTLLSVGFATHAVGQTLCRVVNPVRLPSNMRTGLPGKLVAEQQLSLQSRITGYIAELPVDHGSKVKRGDLLARIDAPYLQAELGQAQAAVAEAAAAVIDRKAAVELARSRVAEAEGAVLVCAADVALADVQARRTRKLVEQNGATPQALDEVEGRLAMARARGAMAEASVESAKAAVKAAVALVGSAEARSKSSQAGLAGAEAMVAFTRLVCPFATAVVTRRRVDAGALVKQDETVLLELQRVDKLRAEFYVPERQAVLIEVGTPVELRIDALSDQALQVKVSRTTGSITKSNVMIVQVDLDNAAGRLLPGMFVYASILLSSDDGVLTLPAKCLHTDGPGEHYVLVAADGVAKKVAVEVSHDNGVRVQIEKGLQGDEAVIVAGLVEPGDAVRIEAGK